MTVARAALVVAAVFAFVTTGSASTAAGPLNDNFLNAAPAPGAPFTASENTSSATLEAGEPQPCPVDTGKTVWYAFTAPSSGTYLVDTYASNFDTILAAYTGSTLASLHKVDCSDDTMSRYQSRLELEANAGVTYRIQAGGYNGAGGALQFTISPAPPIPVNDDFAEPATIGTLPFAHTAHNFAATNEGGEPRTSCSDTEKTVWYRFTPPASGTYQVDTMGSDFDTVLAAYTGSAFNALDEMGCADDITSAQVETSRLTLQLTGGVEYRFQVGGFSASIAGLGTDYGRVVLNMHPPLSGDADADGCTDAEESGSDPVLGGARNMYDPWDFFDVTGDRTVDVADVVLILNHFGHTQGTDVLDVFVDRYIPDPAYPHRTAAASATNAGIDVGDAIASLASFGARCGTACPDTDSDGACNSVDTDDDGDGCPDARELASDPVAGGGRDPLSYWDFFDVTGDQAVGIDDVVDVMQFWGDPGISGEANRRDRWSPDSSRPWRSAEANDGIDVTDALTALASFGHNCR